MDEDAIRTLQGVRHRFRTWKLQGRKMPNYVHGEGDAYLMWLFKIPKNILGDLSFYDEIATKPLENFLGPHGWTYLQVLIARRLADEEAKDNAGLQDV